MWINEFRIRTGSLYTQLVSHSCYKQEKQRCIFKNQLKAVLPNSGHVRFWWNSHMLYYSWRQVHRRISGPAEMNSSKVMKTLKWYFPMLIPIDKFQNCALTVKMKTKKRKILNIKLQQGFVDIFLLNYLTENFF